MTVAARKKHWAIDRCRRLAREGLALREIAADTGLHVLEVEIILREFKPESSPASVRDHFKQGD